MPATAFTSDKVQCEFTVCELIDLKLLVEPEVKHLNSLTEKYKDDEDFCEGLQDSIENHQALLVKISRLLDQ